MTLSILSELPGPGSRSCTDGRSSNAIEKATVEVKVEAVKDWR